MREVGIKLLLEQGYWRRDIITGFHIPPKTSVDHLHMHLAAKPIGRNKYRTLGKKLLRASKAIKYLEKYG